MSNIETWTPTQQAYWETMAARALEKRLPDAQISWLAQTHNAVFNVQNGERRFVLRLSHLAPERTRQMASEMLWLRLLRDIAGLSASYPVQAGALQDDERLVYAALFEYLDGETRDPQTITMYDLNAVGEYLAMLHTFSASFDAPRSFDRPRLDWEGLFGEESVYPLGKGAALFTADHVAIFSEVAEQVRATMTTLGAERTVFGLIHGDLLLKNILFHEDGMVSALDWEYCSWGYYLYDLAPLLWQLCPQPDYEDYADALWEGYSANTPEAEAQRAHLEVLVAARHLASCRWVVGNMTLPAIGGAANAAAILAERTAELRGFLETGRLIRRGQTY